MSQNGRQAQHVLIVGNAPAGEIGPWEEQARAADLVVAVDGGAGHARSQGLRPDVVLGDVDSLDEQTQHWLRRHEVPVVRYPPAKDETDLELALLYAAEAGAQEITIVGALGGRPDQTIANLHLLAHPALAGRRVSIVGPGYRIFLLRGGQAATIEGQTGDTVSLLPLSSQAEGIHTTGLRWALHADTLHRGPARGVSNEMTAARANVRLERGLLLIVHLTAPEGAPESHPPEGPRGPTGNR